MITRDPIIRCEKSARAVNALNNIPTKHQSVEHL